MLKKKLLILLLIFFMNGNLICHKEWVHEYLLKESYRLILNEYGYIPKLAKACGFDEYGNETAPYDHSINVTSWNSTYPILRGVDIEDSDDILWRYGEKIWYSGWQWPRKGAHSSSHFWVTGNLGGDLGTTFLGNGIDGRNAFDKSTCYLKGGKGPTIADDVSNGVIIDPYTIKVKANFTFWQSYVSTQWVKVDYNNLFGFYETGNVSITDYSFGFGSWSWLGSATKVSTPKLNNIDEFHNENFGNQIDREVYSLEIFGRMCHLLGDMSVPAHVKGDGHPCGERLFGAVGLDGDRHELRMGHRYGFNSDCSTYSKDDNDVMVNCDLDPDMTYELPCGSKETFFAKKTFNHNTARSKGGFVWEAFQSRINSDDFDKEFVHYLMYTLNQLSDAFPSLGIGSNGSGEIQGNKDLNKVNTNLTEAENPFINYTYNDINLSGSTTNHIIEEQADLTFNYAIRATATYLIWLSHKLNWIDKPTCKKSRWFFQNERFWGRNMYQPGNIQEFTVSRDGAGKGIIYAGKIVRNDFLNLPEGYKPDIPTGEVTIDPSAVVLFKAEDEVILKDGFYAEKGCYFGAKIGTSTCSNLFLNKKNVDIKETQATYQKDSRISIYPNPAINSIKINYFASQNGNVSIYILDILGNKVADIVKDKILLGGSESNIEFDTSNLNSGSYIVIFQSGDGIETKRLEIMK